MNRKLIALAAILALPAWGQSPVPVIDFESVPNPVHLPKDVYFGEVAGVAVNSKGHVFVFSRGDTSGPAYAAAAAQLLEFAPDGKFIREIGKNLYAWSFAHTVRIDKDDNIWAVDKGSDMIVKFNPDGRVDDGVRAQAGSVRRGHRAAEAPEAAAARRGRALPPADRRGLGPAGNIYISDGYINSRVAKFDKNGDWVKSWGERGDKPGRVQHAAQHRRRRARATSTSPTAATAASRCSTATASSCARSRSTCPFDHDAKPGDRQQARSRREAGHVRAGRAVDALHHAADRTRCCSPSDAYPGRIYKLSLDGKVLGVLGESGKQLKQFGWIHEIACPSRTSSTSPSSSTGACRSCCSSDLVHLRARRATGQLRRRGREPLLRRGRAVPAIRAGKWRALHAGAHQSALRPRRPGARSTRAATARSSRR